MDCYFEGDNWDKPEFFYGRGQISLADKEAASPVAELAERILLGMPESTRGALLNDIDQFLDSLAPTIKRHRQCVKIGLSTSYEWPPANGGPIRAGQSDIEVFDCAEMLAFPAFAAVLQKISKDPERAFLKAVAIIVLRDYKNGDYRSVVKARPSLYRWCARLITRDESTHEKRRLGGYSRGRDETERRENTQVKILELARHLRKASLPARELVRTISERLNRGMDDPYPSQQTIRRMLK